MLGISKRKRSEYRYMYQNIITNIHHVKVCYMIRYVIYLYVKIFKQRHTTDL